MALRQVGWYCEHKKGDKHLRPYGDKYETVKSKKLTAYSAMPLYDEKVCKGAVPMYIGEEGNGF